MNSMKKSVQLAVGALLASAATMPVAQANPFGFTELPGGYQQAEQLKKQDAEPPKEHKCGEGKCGEAHKEEMKKKKEEKAKEHKCGEGKCGEGKCGEGKCGGV